MVELIGAVKQDMLVIDDQWFSPTLNPYLDRMVDTFLHHVHDTVGIGCGGDDCDALGTVVPLVVYRYDQQCGKSQAG